MSDFLEIQESSSGVSFSRGITTLASPTPQVFLETGIPGIPGPQGPQGPQGIPGLVGAGYVHTQASAQTLWIIVHNLGFRPDVAITLDNGTEVEAMVSHNLAGTTTTLMFSEAISGEARLN